MKKLVATLVVLIVIAAAAAFLLTQPDPLEAAALPAHEADLENGERMFYAGGCISCHKPADDDAEADKSLPSGGFAFDTPLGTFYPPNLTPDSETGIGEWSEADFVNAVMRGISPGGGHYMPGFPYASYARMRIEDVLDLHAYLRSLEPVRSQHRLADLRLPVPVGWMPDGLVEWGMRRGFGLWKLVGYSEAPFEPDPSRGEVWNRGAYLVNAPGHCGECHTPRNFMMVPKDGQHLAGGPHPEGKGKVPSLRNLIERDEDYASAEDIKNALIYGEIFGFSDLSSGGMGSVQSNMSQLPEDDVAAIAEYIASLE